MMNKEDIKDRNRLELALDHETRQLISFIAYNWDAAASRMEQIANEREQGLYDDDGTEAIAVFARLERVLSALFAVNGRPQAGTTGIETIGMDGRREATPATMYSVDAPVYNMLGQRMNKNTRGLVIYKGRKYVNK